ncbi:hypothetical protein BDN72DRAFT_778914, partial [Pluteus cervinus]
MSATARRWIPDSVKVSHGRTATKAGPACPTSTTAMLEAQAKIDEEIRALEERLLYLRHSRNELAEINQLPAEILVKIFGYHQVRLVHGDDHRNLVQWVRVAHVCQRWRSIAFDSKVSWTTIPMHQPSYAKLAFRLSDPLAISIIDTR